MDKSDLQGKESDLHIDGPDSQGKESDLHIDDLTRTIEILSEEMKTTPNMKYFLISE